MLHFYKAPSNFQTSIKYARIELGIELNTFIAVIKYNDASYLAGVNSHEERSYVFVLMTERFHELLRWGSLYRFIFSSFSKLFRDIFCIFCNIPVEKVLEQQNNVVPIALLNHS